MSSVQINSMNKLNKLKSIDIETKLNSIREDLLIIMRNVSNLYVILNSASI